MVHTESHTDEDLASRTDKGKESDLSVMSHRPTDSFVADPNTLEMLQLDAVDLDAFEYLTSEMIDPSIFEGFRLAMDGSLQNLLEP